MPSGERLHKRKGRKLYALGYTWKTREMEQPPAAAIHLWHHKSERQAGDIAEVELFTRMRKFLFPLDRGSNDPEMRTNSIYPAICGSVQVSQSGVSWTWWSLEYSLALRTDDIYLVSNPVSKSSTSKSWEVDAGAENCWTVVQLGLSQAAKKMEQAVQALAMWEWRDGTPHFEMKNLMTTCSWIDVFNTWKSEGSQSSWG